VKYYLPCRWCGGDVYRGINGQQCTSCLYAMKHAPLTYSPYPEPREGVAAPTSDFRVAKVTLTVPTAKPKPRRPADEPHDCTVCGFSTKSPDRVCLPCAIL
jgi:hypothetical protein